MKTQPQELSLFKPVATLDAKYVFNEGGENYSITVPGEDNHALLYAAETGYRAEFNDTQAKTYREALKKANIAVAKIGVIYSDTTPEEGYIGDSLEYDSFDLRLDNGVRSYTHNVMKFYDEPYNVASVASNKNLRSKSFETNLEERISSYCALKLPFRILTSTAMPSVLEFQDFTWNSQFHEAFHHSEQCILENLYQGNVGINYLAKQALKMDANYVLGFVLDLHTTRQMCENCNIGILGLQNSVDPDRYLGRLVSAMNGADFRIDTRPELLWSTRVSCQTLLAKDQPYGSYLLPTASSLNTTTIDADTGDVVLQGMASNLRLEQIADEAGYGLDSFAGDFYTSRIVAKQNFEDNVLHGRECFR